MEKYRYNSQTTNKIKFFITLLRQIFQITALKFLFFWKHFAFTLFILTQMLVFSESYFLQTGLFFFCLFECLREILDSFLFCAATRNRNTQRAVKGVFVPHICRDPTALGLYFLSFSKCLRQFTNQTCWCLTSWEWDSTINSFSGAFTNSTDEFYWFYF